MRRRLFCPLLAAAVLATALGGMATPATAAIRIVISDGVSTANDKVFYSSSSTFGSFLSEDFDGYTQIAGNVSSNFQGTSSEGFLSQSVVVSGGTGPLTTLRISAAVIGTLGVSAGPTGQVTTAADILAVMGASPLPFMFPSDQALQVTSRVNTLGAIDTAAVVQLASVVNGSTTTSMTTVDGSVNQTMGTALGGPGYTLASTIVLTGASPGVQGLQLVGRSSVTTLVTPEPAAMLVWGLGAVGLVFAASRRRINPTVA